VNPFRVKERKMDFYGDDDNWKPPSDAELKELERRRERGNKISKLMGQYLLKGYRMLDAMCPVCSAILLQTPIGEGGMKYCVGCMEVDVVQTSTLTTVEKKPKTTTTRVEEPGNKLVSKAKVKVKATFKPPTAQIGQGDDGGGGGGGDVSVEAVATVERKMRWILEQLDATTQVAQVSELLDLLQKCQTTIEQFR